MPYLYFIASELVPRVKIGIANSIPGRLNELRVGSPVELYVLGFVKFENRADLTKEEFALHQLFHQFRLRREWFDLKPELFEDIQNYIFGLPLRPKLPFKPKKQKHGWPPVIRRRRPKKEKPEYYQPGDPEYREPKPIIPFDWNGQKPYNQRAASTKVCYQERGRPIDSSRPCAKIRIVSRCQCGAGKMKWQRFCQPCFNNGRR